MLNAADDLRAAATWAAEHAGDGAVYGDSVSMLRAAAEPSGSWSAAIVALKRAGVHVIVAGSDPC